MRVLLANSVFWPRMVGGAEAVVLTLARALSARGVEVDVLATIGRAGPGAPASRRVEGVAGEVIEAPDAGLYGLLDAVGGDRPPLPRRLVHHALGAASARWERLARATLRRRRPDLLHTHNLAGLTPSLWRAAAAEGVPVVHTLHDYHLLCARTTLLRSRGTLCERPPLPCRALLRAKLAPSRLVAAVTAPSRFVLDRHLAWGAFPRAWAEVVPNAPEPPADPPPARGGAAGGLFLGQLQVHKGVRELLAALARVLAEPEPARFSFDLAGDGPLAAEVAAAAARLGPRCRFLGRVQGAAREEAFARAAFVVLPSRWHDVAPLVILESAARGLPVIGARRGGIPELVRDGVTGQVVEPEPAALAAAIRRYAGDPALARRHGEAAAAWAASFTRARQVEGYLAVYGRVLGRDAG